jgi:D-alanyl-D-alanine carboxypeptidase
MRCSDPSSSTARAGRALRAALTLAALAALLAAGCSDDADGSPGAAEVEPGDGLPSVPEGFEGAVQEVVDGLLDDGPAPGAAMIVRVPGHDDVIVTSGVEQLGTDVPTSADTRFRIGSVTKTFTGAVIQQLVDEGDLALDDTVDAWYPDFPHASDITIDMLLTHTAGVALLPDEQEILLADLTHVFTIDEVVGMLAAREPQFEPGARTGYSNGNFQILAGVIEQVTGTSYADAVEARLAGPLQLEDTAVDDGSDGAPSHGYFTLDGSGPLDVVDFPNTASMTLAGGAGGVTSTLPDLVDWAEALYTGEVLEPDTTAAMLESVAVGGPDGDLFVDGRSILGFCPCGDGPPWSPVMVGHDGAFPGSVTVMAHDPETGLIIVGRTNWFGEGDRLVDAALDVRRLLSDG